MRKKVNCEICGFNDVKVLHRHHIIPRCDKRSTNSDHNLAIVCPTCHSLIHAGEIIIIGLYQTTSGIQLFWFKNGTEPPLPRECWQIQENPLVIKGNGGKDGRES